MKVEDQVLSTTLQEQPHPVEIALRLLQSILLLSATSEAGQQNSMIDLIKSYKVVQQ